MLNNIAIHERGHQAAFAFYNVPARIEGNLCIPEPGHNLQLNEHLAVLVAGAVNESIHFPGNDRLHTGLGGDARLLCNKLGVSETKEINYALAVALIVLSINTRLAIPDEHAALLRIAVRQAKDILEKKREMQ
jgi:hypothetical protein